MNVSSVSTSSRTASAREPPAPLPRWRVACAPPTATASSMTTGTSSPPAAPSLPAAACPALAARADAWALCTLARDAAGTAPARACGASTARRMPGLTAPEGVMPNSPVALTSTAGGAVPARLVRGWDADVHSAPAALPSPHSSSRHARNCDAAPSTTFARAGPRRERHAALHRGELLNASGMSLMSVAGWSAAYAAAATAVCVLPSGRSNPNAAATPPVTLLGGAVPEPATSLSSSLTASSCVRDGGGVSSGCRYLLLRWLCLGAHNSSGKCAVGAWPSRLGKRKKGGGGCDSAAAASRSRVLGGHDAELPRALGQEPSPRSSGSAARRSLAERLRLSAVACGARAASRDEAKS